MQRQGRKLTHAHSHTIPTGPRACGGELTVAGPRRPRGRWRAAPGVTPRGRLPCLCALALLVRTLGPALRLGVCFLGCPAVVFRRYTAVQYTRRHTTPVQHRRHLTKGGLLEYCPRAASKLFPLLLLVVKHSLLHQTAGVSCPVFSTCCHHKARAHTEGMNMCFASWSSQFNTHIGPSTTAPLCSRHTKTCAVHSLSNKLHVQKEIGVHLCTNTHPEPAQNLACMWKPMQLHAKQRPVHASFDDPSFSLCTCVTQLCCTFSCEQLVAEALHSALKRLSGTLSRCTLCGDASYNKRVPAPSKEYSAVL